VIATTGATKNKCEKKKNEPKRSACEEETLVRTEEEK